MFCQNLPDDILHKIFTLAAENIAQSEFYIRWILTNHSNLHIHIYPHMTNDTRSNFESLRPVHDFLKSSMEQHTTQQIKSKILEAFFVWEMWELRTMVEIDKTALFPFAQRMMQEVSQHFGYVLCGSEQKPSSFTDVTHISVFRFCRLQKRVVPSKAFLSEFTKKSFV